VAAWLGNLGCTVIDRGERLMGGGVAMPRHKILDRILKLDPERDHLEIVYLDNCYEFPFEITRGVEFALFRTFAVPSISALLDRTGEFQNRPQKRSDDTALILSEIVEHGYDSERGRAAIRRMNQMHRRFDIANDDYLYVMSTFVFESIRWVDRFGWRPMVEQEKLAAFYFWREIARRMNIKSLPNDFHVFERFNIEYERAHFRYSETNRRVGIATRDLFLSWMLPRPLWHLGEPAVYAMMDDPLREAFGFPQAPEAIRRFVRMSLRLRARAMRWMPERRRPVLRTRKRHRTYPHGYRIDDLGVEMTQMHSTSLVKPDGHVPSLRDPQRDSFALHLPKHIRINLAGLPVPSPPPRVTPTPLPSGQRGLPGLGMALDFQFNPLAMIRKGHERYGPIFSSNFLGTPIIWLLGPEANEKVLETHVSNFLWRPALMRVVCLLGEGMITSDGAVHDSQRELVVPALHKEQVASYLDTMIAVTDQVLATWPVGQEINVFEEMRRITLQVGAQALLGMDIEQTQAGLRRWFTIAGNYLDLSPPFNALRLNLPGTPWAKFTHARRQIDALLLDEIAQRRVHPGRHTNILNTLIQARTADGAPLSDEQIRDACMTLLITALNEPANMMTWLQYLLAKHPHVRDRLLEEHQRVLGNRRPMLADLKELTYLDWTLKETLRLYPAIWISMRLAIEPFSFGGYDFHPGTFVGLSRYLTHRMPEIFASPEEFIPERFDPAHAENHPPYAYLPFGAGSRVCPGAAFAMLEGKAIMARLLGRYRLLLREGYHADPHVGVTLGVRGGLPMTVAPN
jgi:cytochrome P450